VDGDPFGLKSLREVVMSTSVVTAIGAILGVVISLALGLAAFGFIKKSVIDMLKLSNDSLEKANVILEKENKLLLGKLADIQAGMNAQDSRIFRMELEGERKNRLWVKSAHEIELLERALHIAMSALVRLQCGNEDADRVQEVLHDLYEYRKKQQREMEEWETTITAQMAYNERRAPYHMRKSDSHEATPGGD